MRNSVVLRLLHAAFTIITIQTQTIPAFAFAFPTTPPQQQPRYYDEHHPNIRTRLKELDRASHALLNAETTTVPVVSIIPLCEDVAYACLDVCRALVPSSCDDDESSSVWILDRATTTNAEYLSSSTQTQPQPSEEELLHFFDVRLWDITVKTLAHALQQHTYSNNTNTKKDATPKIMEVAQAVSASARLVLLPKQSTAQILDDLDAALLHPHFLSIRKDDIQNANHINSHRTRMELDSITDEEAASNDHQIISALYKCAIQMLSQNTTILSSSSFTKSGGFPATRLGLHSFCAAANLATDGQRAAASLSRVWHAADDYGPLAFVPPYDKQRSSDQTKHNHTLVILFSSLGWNGVIRTEWGNTLKYASANHYNPNTTTILHAFDTCRSWYTSNPITGEIDDGKWWDGTLANICRYYKRICILGDSMGGTAALRYARHTKGGGRVFSFVPQIHLADFGHYKERKELTVDHQRRLCTNIQHAVSSSTNSKSSSRVVIHVGRDVDDLGQLSYIQEIVNDHEALGMQVDDPLPRDGMQMKQVVGSDTLCVVKHDVEGHALGVGLKEMGVLKEIVLGDLFGDGSWADAL